MYSELRPTDSREPSWNFDTVLNEIDNRMNPDLAADRWLFVSDVDDTLLGDDIALSELKAVLGRERHRVIFALNSSRPCLSVRGTMTKLGSLPEPDFLIGALGTEIEDTHGSRIEEYAKGLETDWDIDRVRALVSPAEARPHSEEYQTPLKVSFEITDRSVAERIRSRLSTAGLAAKVLVTHGTKMDVIPADAGKGAAISYVREQLDVDRGRVVVAGDSANDVDMFRGRNKGIVVANADPELARLAGPQVYVARASFAAGVLEGLRHWNVL